MTTTLDPGSETASALTLTPPDKAAQQKATAAAIQARQRHLARIAWVLGSLVCLVAVAAGAFGAHGLRSRVTTDLLAVFETGARYQMYHGLALLGLGLAAGLNLLSPRFTQAALILFFAGTVIFSGSLYILVLTDVRQWGAVTPIGGVLQIAGWLTMAIGAWRHGHPHDHA